MPSRSPSRFQFRRANASAWASSNPVLEAGELGYELDTKKFKIGDGTTAWNDLIYNFSPTQPAELTRVFNKTGSVEIKEYEGWYADKNYKFIRLRAVVGKHDAATHPYDGCPRGSSIKLNIKKYGVNFDDGTGTASNLFTSPSKIEITALSHKSNNWIEQSDPDLQWTTIAKNEQIRVNVTDVGSQFSGDHLRVFFVLEPI